MINFMSIEGLFGNNFLDIFGEMTSASFFDFLISIGIAFLLGLILYLLYSLTYRGVAYQKSFHESLIFICMISAMIIAIVSSNIILSLGMVGALSIIRFRTPIKDPLDMMYLFLSIGVGIATGARQYAIAAFSTLFIGILLFFFSRRKPLKSTFMLVIRFKGDSSDEIKEALRSYKTSFKSSAVSGGMTELTLEITGKNLSDEVTQKISAIQGVESAVMMKFTGD